MRDGWMGAVRGNCLGFTGAVAVCLWGAGCQQGVHDASDDLRRSAAGETTTPYSIVSTTQPTRIDDGCAMRFTVAADTPVVLGVNVDGAPARFWGHASTMVPDVTQVNEQCESGPAFGTDDIASLAEGNETPGLSFVIGTLDPPTLPAEYLPTDGVVLIDFDSPQLFRVLVLASADSMVTELIIDAPIVEENP